MKEEYFKWHSDYLNREFEMLVFGHSGYPVILFPPSRGRFYDNKEFGMIGSAADLIDQGKIKIYCPDSADAQSWYNFSINPSERVTTHIAYENTIINEVIGYIKHDTGLDKTAATGCSLGAYHAANLAFRHPDLISHVFGMGGIFNIKQFIFGFYDDNSYFNNPPDYLPNLNDPWYLDRIREMKIVLGTGSDDMYLKENISLSDILKQKNINHWLDIRNSEGNDFSAWRKMLPRYLGLING